MSTIVCILILITTTGYLGKAQARLQQTWKRHSIDSSSIGADGVRLSDVNRDGRMDITTGWEEGGVIRVYLHPGRNSVKSPWPQITVGSVTSPEDAVFCDLNGDGNFDVISSCEGKNKSVYFHWAPADESQFMDPHSWKTESVPSVAKVQSWMFAAPVQLDGKYGPEIVLGSKGRNASIGYLSSPENPRITSDWEYIKIRDAGWIMSLRIHDMDGDGDPDILASDRRTIHSGIFWLENPNLAIEPPPVIWKEHPIGLEGREIMFIDYSDEPSTALHVAAAVKPNQIHLFHRSRDSNQFQEKLKITLPASFGTSKAVRIGDIDLDGTPDLVFTCEQASNGLSGVGWFKLNSSGKLVASTGICNDISGPEGTKFDRIELIDLDEDGDLDLLTCEERERLGVIWYENPTR